MKRYASHFLFLPGHGYLRHYVIETEEGCVTHLFPLTEEIENVEWLPGAIILLNEEQLKELDNNSTDINPHNHYTKIREDLLINSGRFINKLWRNSLINFPPTINGALRQQPVYFQNFDITTMLPVYGTRHRLLR